MKKIRLEQPMRAPYPLWAEFLLSVAKGPTHSIQNGMELREHFNVTVTTSVDDAFSFFCYGLEPYDPFPLDHQWICATNKSVN
jgi:hypothetical protein